jgi:hypothetical protein
MEPNAADRYGRTALHIAAIRGDKKVKTVQKLLNAGASIDVKDERGATALHYAAANNGRKMVTLMISQRNPVPNVNATDIDGQTPLHLAAAQNLLDVVKLLVGVDDNIPKWCPKADHTIKDHRGKAALDYAKIRQANAEQLGEKAIVQLLKLLPPPKRVSSHTYNAGPHEPGPAAVPAEQLLLNTHSRVAASSLEPTARSRVAETDHSTRVARARIDRQECPVGKPITARWGVPSNTVDPWLERWIRRTTTANTGAPRGAKRIEGERRDRRNHTAGSKVQHPRPWVALSKPCADDNRAR